MQVVSLKSRFEAESGKLFGRSNKPGDFQESIILHRVCSTAAVIAQEDVPIN